MKKELIELRVNGRRHELAVEPSELLLDVLRRDLQLTGSKRGCDDSSCGACTVLVDGIPTLACTMLAFSAAANGPVTPDITTVEGIADHGALAQPAGKQAVHSISTGCHEEEHEGWDEAALQNGNDQEWGEADAQEGKQVGGHTQRISTPR